MVFFRNVLRLLVIAIIVPNSPILITLISEAILFREMSVLTRATLRNISEDGIPSLFNCYSKNVSKPFIGISNI
jgi:hypothetical protein